MKRKPFIIIAIVLVFLFGIYYTKKKSPQLIQTFNSNTIKSGSFADAKNPNNSGSNASKQETYKAEPSKSPVLSPKPTMKVDITGEVKKPGIYEAKDGDRVIDIVNKAGGFTEKAVTSEVNLVKYVVDAEQIKIPNSTDIVKSSKAASSSTSKIEKNSNVVININTASKDQLQSLSGIGSATADNIIKYRVKHGNFKKIQDIKKVKRIGDKIFNDIKSNISVG